MQAQGIEVGLVAKLAGHASPNVTLSHYTQAVRNGDAAVKALEEAYSLAGSGGRRRERDAAPGHGPVDAGRFSRGTYRKMRR
jgi:hypothetical protein